MYKSVLKEESCEITIKKSIFISNLSPVSNEEEAESFISKIRKNILKQGTIATLILLEKIDSHKSTLMMVSHKELQVCQYSIF